MPEPDPRDDGQRDGVDDVEDGARQGHEANPGFAAAQLAKAFATSLEHEDPDTRVRASERAMRWIRTLQGMLSGVLRVGSRQPMRYAPVWATPEVIHGGFVTGTLLAGGALLPHETALLERLGPPASSSTARASLNAWYLEADGIADLLTRLEAGTYRIAVPEEAALPVVAWLLQRGEIEAAREVVEEIEPFFASLRFYPRPAATALEEGDRVHLHTVGDVRERLRQVELPPAVARERETLSVWFPLYDRMIALFAETVSGEAPGRGPDGRATGGWPCQHFPGDWAERARATLDEIERREAVHTLCRRPHDESRYFPRLRRHLDACCRDPRRLTGAQVGEIRGILADVREKRGLPDSTRCRALRADQAARAAAPTLPQYAAIVAGRLASYSEEEGLTEAEIDAALEPVSPAEGAEHGVPPGEEIPWALAYKIGSCLSAPLDTLVAEGILPSSETLAAVLPWLVARTRSEAFPDPALRRLYRALYTAFRRRRSLLLLNLEHQVRFHELPWAAAILPFRRAGTSERDAARRVLEELALLALRAFPYSILPNKLLQEILSLSAEAGLEMPITDELAADIFMGAFTDKYVRAAQCAANLLGGRLYETYYGIPFDQVLRMQVPVPTPAGPGVSKPFLRLCGWLAPADDSHRATVARNGTIIEQQQILTTHNLAALFDAFGLHETLAGELKDLARACFAWICRSFAMRVVGWQPRLRRIKNAAYAWRQMVFFLSFLPADGQRDFLFWASGELASQPGGFAVDFQPALRGLEMAVEGRSPPRDEEEEGWGLGRRFLGWTIGRHWLMGEA